MEFIERIIAWYKGPRKSAFVEYTESIVTIVIAAFLIRTFGFGLYQVPTCSMETTMLAGERFFADKFTILFKKPKHGDIISFNDPKYPYSKNKFGRLWEHYVGVIPFMSWGPANWTKRVIGIPGDHIKGVIEDGKPVVYRNGEKLNEPYLNKYPIVSVFTRNPRDPLVRRSYDPSKSYEDQPFYRLNKEDIFIGEKLSRRFGQSDILYPGTPAMEHDGFSARNLDEFDFILKENQYWAMGDNRLGSYDSRAWGPLDGNLIHGKIVFRIWSIDSDYSWWILDLLKHPIDFWLRVRWGRCVERVL